MLILPSNYNSSPDEIINQAKNLGMSYEIIKPSWFQLLFRKNSVTEREAVEVRIHIHPHGLNDEQRLHSLMFFFHCLGTSKHHQSLIHNR